MAYDSYMSILFLSVHLKYFLIKNFNKNQRRFSRIVRTRASIY